MIYMSKIFKTIESMRFRLGPYNKVMMRGGGGGVGRGKCMPFSEKRQSLHF